MINVLSKFNFQVLIERGEKQRRHILKRIEEEGLEDCSSGTSTSLQRLERKQHSSLIGYISLQYIDYSWYEHLVAGAGLLRKFDS